MAPTGFRFWRSSIKRTARTRNGDASRELSAKRPEMDELKLSGRAVQPANLEHRRVHGIESALEGERENL